MWLVHETTLSNLKQILEDGVLKPSSKTQRERHGEFLDHVFMSVLFDDEKIEDELGKKQQELKDNGKDKDEIEFEIKNWKLLDALRIYKKDSFDFSIQTACAYSNIELLIKACDILILKLDDLNKIINDDKLEINNSQNTMSNCFDIILKS